MNGPDNKGAGGFSEAFGGEPKEFKPPRWKKIIGEEHITSVVDIEVDLLAIEEFMNNMLAHGWKPLRVKGGTQFSFVRCKPGEFICRTMLTVTKNGFFDKQKAAELTSLLEADNATIVPQERITGARVGIIALRPSELGAFETHTDLDSRIEEYKARKQYSERSGMLFFIVGLAWIATGFLEVTYAALAVVWIILGGIYYRPVPRYKRIIEQLEAERNISEI